MGIAESLLFYFGFVFVEKKKKRCPACSYLTVLVSAQHVTSCRRRIHQPAQELLVWPGASTQARQFVEFRVRWLGTDR